MAALVYDTLPSLINAASPANIIECGCHEGWDTRELRKLFPAARLVALEPDPRNLEKLRSGGVDKLAHIIPAAVSFECGRATFHLSGANLTTQHPDWLREAAYAGSSSLKAPAEVTAIHKWLTFDEAVEVDTVTLDSIVQRHGFETIDLVWADVQGAEDLLIAGGQGALARTRYLYTEFSDAQEYSGQIPMREILARLPGRWSIVKQYDFDVLLKNETLAAASGAGGSTTCTATCATTNEPAVEADVPYLRKLRPALNRVSGVGGRTLRELAQWQAEALWLAAGSGAGRPKPEFRSQNGEDVLLWALLGGAAIGRFIEVGAFDGFSFSVSYGFESVGWTGLLVEPLPDQFAACVARRGTFSRVVNAALGPAGSIGEAEFTVVGGGEMLSYLSLTDGHAARLARETAVVPRTVRAPLTSMDALLEADPAMDKPGAIDFAVIDVEGGELALLQGFDLTRFRPRVLLVEDNAMGRDTTVRRRIEAQGYWCVGNLEANDVFISRAEPALLARFVKWFC